MIIRRLLSTVPSGNGGRHSNNGLRVTILGATGFVGRYLVNALGRSGTTMCVATQGDDMSWRHLKPLADYGKLFPAYIHLKDEDSLREAVAGADVVVNLIGKHYETKHYVPTIVNASFEDVHVNGAQRIARIAREANVKHFVHLSSIAARAESPSKWATTKAKGEDQISAEFPGAVIIKSNQIYGEEDRFLNNFAAQAKLFPRVPVVNGAQAKVYPIYVGDVAKALSVAVQNWNETVGQTFHIQGKDAYSYADIAKYVFHQMHRSSDIIDIPLKYAEQFGRATELFPNPVVTKDYYQLMAQDQIADESLPGLTALGIEPASFESKAFNFLYKYRTGGHFLDPNSSQQSAHQ